MSANNHDAEEFNDRRGLGKTSLQDAVNMNKQSIYSNDEIQLGASIKIWGQAKNLSLEEFMTWINDRYTINLK